MDRANAYGGGAMGSLLGLVGGGLAGERIANAAINRKIIQEITKRRKHLARVGGVGLGVTGLDTAGLAAALS